MTDQSAQESNSSPTLAIISNAQTPYRLHLHRRIANEVTGLRLASIYTHGESNSPWMVQEAQETHPVFFGSSESSQNQGRPGYALHEWRKAGRIIRWLAQHSAAAVLVGGYNDLGRIRIIRWCRKNCIPCGLIADSNILGDRASGLAAMFKRRIVSAVVSSCRWILPCGTLGAAYFKKYGAAEEQIFFFPYEPDYDLIRAIQPRQVEAVARRFGLAAERKRLIYSGRLVAVKRLDLVIDAFVAIAEQRPQWDLVIAGDGPLRENLLKRIPAALRGRIIWTGFIDDQAIVSTLYHASDVLVLASDVEPWALVINEAVAAGLAIVSSDVVGASAELVRDGINGRIFKVGQVKDLERVLLDVTEPDRADAMKAASASVLADWRKRADPVEGLQRALKSANIIHD